MPALRNDLLQVALGDLNLKTAAGGISAIKIADNSPTRMPLLLRHAGNSNNVFWLELTDPNTVAGLRGLID